MQSKKLSWMRRNSKHFNDTRSIAQKKKTWTYVCSTISGASATRYVTTCMNIRMWRRKKRSYISTGRLSNQLRILLRVAGAHPGRPLRPQLRRDRLPPAIIKPETTANNATRGSVQSLIQAMIEQKSAPLAIVTQSYSAAKFAPL
jgi:hypothetical protein